MFKSFKELNDSIAKLKELPVIQPLQQALSIIKSILATVSYLPSEYARLYAQVQQLKYDPTTGDVSDVTPDSQSTIPDSAIAQAKQSIDKLMQSLTSLKSLTVKQNVVAAGNQTLSYFGVYLKHNADTVLDYGIRDPGKVDLVGSDIKSIKPKWTNICLSGQKTSHGITTEVYVSPVISSDGKFIMAGFYYKKSHACVGGYFFVNVHTYEIYVISQALDKDGDKSPISKYSVPGDQYITNPINDPMMYFSSVQGLVATATTVATGVQYFYGIPLIDDYSIVKMSNQPGWVLDNNQDPNGKRFYAELDIAATNPQSSDFIKSDVDVKGFDVTIGDILPDVQPIVESLNLL